ncbi:MAG TPA: hypothetical protein VK694_02745 [Verrucomicrobiae bacterium]|nr:hypothetical protein [Verrucomicrobiae bacterium]
MSVKQYTIRNIPPQVDSYLRKRARLSGKSLNEVVIAELSANAGVGKKSIVDSLDWFIGSNSMDDATLKAIDSADRDQKNIMAREIKSDH